jgi:hypothetical protein
MNDLTGGSGSLTENISTQDLGRYPFTSPVALPFDYDPRVLTREPGSPYHSFPFTFDPHVWYEGDTCRSSLNPSGPSLNWGYYECRCLEGALNGKVGRYEFGVRIPTVFENPFNLFDAPRPTVVHRAFIPFQ